MMLHPKRASRAWATKQSLLLTDNSVSLYVNTVQDSFINCVEDGQKTYALFESLHYQ